MAEALKTRPAGKEQEIDDEAAVVDVRIDRLFGSHNVYEFDRKHGALRLARFVTGDGPCEVEQGAAQRTLSEGEPLPALLLTPAPTFPGCIVRMRVLGAAQVSDAPPWLVGVLQVATAADWQTIADLPEQTRAALRSVIDVEGVDRLAWLDASAARSVVTEARESYWVEKAKAEGAARYGAAWKVTPGAGMRKTDALAAHTVAEYLLPSLPSRFQKYVEEELLPGERILFFAARPSFAPGSKRLSLPKQRLREGLLVVTDRQVMMMTDSIPPDSTLVRWGFIAKATAVERLRDVRLAEDGASCQLELSFGAADGVERYSLVFPRNYNDALSEAVALLDRFAELEGCHALRRLYDKEVEIAGRAASGGVGDQPSDETRLEELVRQIEDSEDVIATASARPVGGMATGPALVLCDSRLILSPGAKKRGRSTTVSHPIAQISSTEITQSLVGCRFEVFVPNGDGVDIVGLDYDYPDSPRFLRAFTLLRHLLGQPILELVRE
jgi:inorganic pyrophosphatase